ncbi:tubulin-specific chaperone e protein [Rutstroemia sp. NJR-2017a WRK4]|nr:tubulin-specific chaperone e protein [Rutstroemia sp. NJR-2017a WRK4]PQE14919.1 tubulin-specific chaperone e protein [Rutstroemia sp. NJR-2017a WRK4]
MTHNYRVGQRVSFEGQPCTIRYIGNVQGTGKEWLGVEWDNPSRGKHDGQGLFKCLSRSPTAGSFIRPTRKADPEQSFVEAVYHKYVTQSTTSTPAPSFVAADKQIVISGKVAEEIGFEKIRQQQAQVDELKVVLVDGLCINRAESGSSKVKDVCPKIVELDLSRNLFEGVEEIGMICVQLEKLKSLRLNGNRLYVDSVELQVCQQQQAFSKVKSLELDEMLIDWVDLCRLLEGFPFITTLAASSNCFGTLRWPLKHACLTSLTLEYNQFKTLADISSLSGLLSLESLLLKGNEISLIETTTNSGTGEKKTEENVIRDTTPVFGTNLRYIDLSYNKINDWSFVDTLAYVFPGMTSLRLSHNPLYQKPAANGENPSGDIEEGFMITLARLGNLKTLNFSNITAAERTNAELFYLSRIGKEIEAVPNSEEQAVIARHKRYHELCKLHDPPKIVREKIKVDPETLQSRLIKFTFLVPSSLQTDQTGDSIQKEIPNSFDIYRVKGIVGRLLGVKPMSLRLIWETGEWDPVAGYEDTNSDEEEQTKTERRKSVQTPSEQQRKAGGQLVKREVELEDGTRPVGNCVDGKEVTIRVELRK